MNLMKAVNHLNKTSEKIDYSEATPERIQACLKACEGIKTSALNKGFVQDLFREYFELCDIRELEALMTCCEGNLFTVVLEAVNNSWNEINSWDLESNK